MSGKFGLEPPWDTDQAALNAAEIMAEVKAATGKYRELDEHRIVCGCAAQPRTLARVFIGPDDDGVMRVWVWVTSQRSASGLVPAQCIPVPRVAGEKGFPMIAQCPRCRSGWALLLGVNGPGSVGRLRIGSPTRGRVVDDMS